MKRMEPGAIGAILFIVWLFAPFRLIVSDADGGIFFSILAMTWVYNAWSNYPNQFIFFEPGHLLMGLFYGLFLFIFIVAIVRYSQHSTTRKGVMVSAILSQGPILFEMLIYLVTRFPFNTGFILSLPAPILLAIGILLVRNIDYLQPKTPWSSLES